MAKKERPETVVPSDGPGSNSAELVKRYAETIVKHTQEIQDTREFIKAARDEAKANGLDTRALNAVVKAMMADEDDRLERETLDRLYIKAAGLKVAE